MFKYFKSRILTWDYLFSIYLIIYILINILNFDFIIVIIKSIYLILFNYFNIQNLKIVFYF